MNGLVYLYRIAKMYDQVDCPLNCDGCPLNFESGECSSIDDAIRWIEIEKYAFYDCDLFALREGRLGDLL